VATEQLVEAAGGDRLPLVDDRDAIANVLGLGEQVSCDTSASAGGPSRRDPS
jgi:hypothetical protein